MLTKARQTLQACQSHALWLVLCTILLGSLSSPLVVLAKDFTFSWSANPEPVQGYRLYYKKGGVAQPPFDGSGANEGPSPIDIGKKNTITVTGLVEDNSIYHFSLTAYYENLESDYSAVISVIAEKTELKAVITASGTEGTAPYTVQLDGDSSTGSISQYGWDFGDGDTDSGQTASHQFTSPGNYVTTLTVTDQNNEKDQATLAITVNKPASPPTTGSPPIAILSPSTTEGKAPLTVRFDGSSSSSEQTPLVYEWTFGDGSSTEHGEVANHIYTDPGSYQAKLKVTDNAGLFSVASREILVTNAAPEAQQPPVARFIASPTTGTPPLRVSLNPVGSVDPDGTISRYLWSFGDGSSSTQARPTHLYTKLGNYQVTLRVTDNDGLSSTATGTIVLIPKNEYETLISRWRTMGNIFIFLLEGEEEE